MNKLEKYVTPTLDVEVIEIEQGIAAGSTFEAQHSGAPNVNGYTDGGTSEYGLEAN